ncbi:MAG: nickel-dependent lactate racemase [Clostridiales bacterium]|nr:nickel-dependent lactate racemase [Clostridiales bacterium]
MRYELKYDNKTMDIHIDDKNLIGILNANKIQVDLMGDEEVKRALENPIGTKKIRDIVEPGEKIAIITSDITRPMPSKKVLPHVLEELNIAGVSKEDIIIVFALGSHRKHTVDEMKYLVGEDIYNNYKCMDSDIEDYIRLGYTDNNTPIDIFRPVAKAHRRICLGNIEFHYFAGYSGGAKAIMPGVSTRKAVEVNHSKMVDEKAHAGNIDTNPVRLDIEETIKLVPIDFILNVVLNENKEIIKAVAGHYIHAHRVGCEFLDALYKVNLDERADIVITSIGGYPKDINLYQAQKALDNAKHAVKDGGIIILVASCKEGLGEDVFEKWILEAEKPEDLINRVKKKFELGGHKAAAIAMVLEKSRVFLVSEMDEDFVRKIFLEPYNSVQKAYEDALKIIGNNARVYLIPNGGSVLPVVL